MIKNSNWEIIQIRPPNISDIPIYVNYWYRGPFKDIRSPYINWEKFPKESDMEKGLRDKIESKEHMLKPLLYMVELHGKTIGMHTLNEVNEVSGDIHAHYFDREYVGKGYGLVSGVKAARKFFETHGFEYIYARPPQANQMSTKMMSKIPFVEHLGIEEIKYVMIKSGTLGNSYRLSREKLDDLEAYIKNLKWP